VAGLILVPNIVQAEHWALHPKGNVPVGIFSPDLALVAYGRAQLVGQSASGVTVFDIPADSELARSGIALDRSFTVSQDFDRDAGIDRNVELIVSHQSWRKPSRRELRNAGFEVVDDFARGRFIVLRPTVLPLQGDRLKQLGVVQGIQRVSVNYALSAPPPVDDGDVAQPDRPGAPPNTNGVPEAVVNDPRWPEQWGLRDIDVQSPWREGTTGYGKDVVVAVIDTGVDYHHEDLRANMWVNPDEKVNGKDDDANGIIDDIHGVNFIENTGDPMDLDGHGTHCAGIIGAVGNNGRGISGVNWKTQLMALKFMGRRKGDPTMGATGRTSDAVKCFFYAIDQGVDVINCSFGSPVHSHELELAIRRAQEKDIIVVAAAGNDGRNIDVTPTYPASFAAFSFQYRNVISVAALNEKGQMASYSNYGPHAVQLAAPGHGILSTLPGNGYGVRNGTSMAAPHVTGAIALIKAHRYLAPANWKQVREFILLKHVRKLDTLTGRCESNGTLNLEFLGTMPFTGQTAPTIASTSVPPTVPLPDPDSGPTASGEGLPPGPVLAAASPTNLTIETGASLSRTGDSAQPMSFSKSDYNYEPRVLTSSDNVLTLEFELPREMDVFIRAEASATVKEKSRLVSVGFCQSQSLEAPLIRQSQRLTTVRSGDGDDFTLLTNNHATRLGAGHHTVSWRMNMVGNGPGVALQGGAGLFVRAFPIPAQD
jgi:subtilisin family serine protease